PPLFPYTTLFRSDPEPASERGGFDRHRGIAADGCPGWRGSHGRRHADPPAERAGSDRQCGPPPPARSTEDKVENGDHHGGLGSSSPGSSCLIAAVLLYTSKSSTPSTAPRRCDARS